MVAAASTENVKELPETLQPDQQEVLVLRIVADLSLETTAEIMGKPPEPSNSSSAGPSAGSGNSVPH